MLELAEPAALLRTVFDAAASTGLFAEEGVGGIKVRLRPYERTTYRDRSMLGQPPAEGA